MDDDNGTLERSQRRLLRRLYNGRTVPIVASEQSFLTYQAAARYLLSLTIEAREIAYLEMKAFVQAENRGE